MPIRRCLALALLATTFQVISATQIHRFTLRKLTLEKACSQESIAGPLCHTLRKRSIASESPNRVHSLALTNYINVMFHGEVSLGTPPQLLNFSFDTSTPYVFVTSKTCGIRFTNPYDSRKSSTYNGIGVCMNEGKELTSHSEVSLSTDVLKIGNAPINNQSFIEGVHKKTTTYASYNISGVIGLGFSSDPRVITPLDNLYKQHQIDKRIFSFYFNRSQGENGGHLTLGGMEGKFYRNETLKYIPLSKDNAWQIRVDNVTIPGGGAWCTNGSQATISVGVPLICGPKDVVQSVYKYLGFPTEADQPRYIPCSRVGTLPPITFYIDGHNFTLHDRDYIFKIHTPFGTPCLIGFQWNDDKPKDWFLGNIFISKFYSIFDAEKKRIGLAELK